jgi:tetratricopeptide (TPR) repeat protein
MRPPRRLPADPYRARTFLGDALAWLALLTLGSAGLLAGHAWIHRDVLRDLPELEGATNPRIAVLAYDRVVERPDGRHVDRGLFRSQLAVLARAGFQPVTLEALRRFYREEGALPPRSVLLTFDHGYLSTFDAVDPVLRERKWPAVMFVMTERQERCDPFFLYWPGLKVMVDSGIWEIGSHGHQGHNPVVTDALGTEGAFFVRRAWLPEDGREESWQEFGERVVEDHRHARALIQEHLGRTPLAYAPPLRDVAVASLDPEVHSTYEDTLRALYALAFVDDLFGVNDRTSDRLHLKRLRMSAALSAEDLEQRLSHALGGEAAGPGTDEHLKRLWVAGTGTATPQGPLLVASGVARADLWRAGSQWCEDWVLEADARIEAGQLWVVQQSADLSEEWRWGGDENRTHLQRRRPGQPVETLASFPAPIEPGRFHHLKVVRRGTGVAGLSSRALARERGARHLGRGGGGTSAAREPPLLPGALPRAAGRQPPHGGGGPGSDSRGAFHQRALPRLAGARGGRPRVVAPGQRPAVDPGAALRLGDRADPEGAPRRRGVPRGPAARSPGPRQGSRLGGSAPRPGCPSAERPGHHREERSRGAKGREARPQAGLRSWRRPEGGRRRSRPMTARLILTLPAVFVLAALGLEAASRGQDALDRGTGLYKAGRYAEAMEAFREATRLDPGLLRAWENLGWALHRSGRHAEAIQTWLTVLKVEPTRTELLNEMAGIQMGENHWSEAAQTLTRSLAADDDQPRIRLRLAAAEEKAGRLQAAEAQYREALRRQPADISTVLRLEEFLERTGKDDDALALLRGAPLRALPYRAVLDLRIGRLQARKGDRAYREGAYAVALRAYDEAVASDPENSQYWINRGWAHRQLGSLGEASAAWRHALELDPGKTALYRHVADAAFEQEDLRTAAAMYGRAWAGAERQPSIPYRLAEIALEEGRSDESMAWLDELFALPDADAEWSLRVASLFARAEQPGPGIELFRRRLASSRAPQETRRALARLHAFTGSMAFQAGQLEGAMRELEEAVALDPKSRQALRDLGWVYWSTEHWDECADMWERYASAYPDDPQPHNLLAHVHLKRKEYPAAAAEARFSLRLDPAQPATRLKLARALFAGGQYAEARSLAEAVACESPEDAGAQVFWAELLMQYHDFARGEPQWRRVLGLGVHTPKGEYYWLRSLYELGQYDAAVAQAKRLLEEEGPKQTLFQFLAEDATLRGDTAEAIRWYRKMVESSPERLSAWLELARLEQDAGELEAARRDLACAQRQHPDRMDVALAQAELERRAGRAAEAHAAFVSLSNAHPGNRDAFFGRLETALEAGRPEEAMSVLRTGRETFLKPYESRMQEARIRFAMGQEAEAQRALAGVTSPGRGAYVPVLLYHGIGDHPRSPNLPAALFDSQMRALQEAGFTAITVSELGGMREGRVAFPERPILVTFDDARLDSFERADPILARYGMKATMFVPTGRILDEHPFFADWKRIAAWTKTGRWELQSHGHFAHDPIAVDAAEQQGSFLVNREWLTEARRLETYQEYRTRLDDDYERSIHEIESHAPGAPPIGYAFPFSEAGQETVGNEEKAAQTNQELLASHFRFGFVQDESGYNELEAGGTRTLLLRRFAVPRDYDGESLLRHLARHDPKAAALAQSARMHYWTGDYDRAREVWERVVLAEPRMEGEAAYFLAAIQYQRGRYDVARRHLRTAESLQPERFEADRGLASRIRWQGGSRLAPRIDLFSDSDGRESQWAGAEIQAPPLGPLAASFAYGGLTLRQEGLASLTGRELSAAARLGPFGHLIIEGRGWQRAMDGAKDTLSFDAGLGVETDWLKLRLHGGRQDVDTLLARSIGLQADRYAAQASVRFSRLVSASVDAAYDRLDDANERRDVAGSVLLKPRFGHGLGLGAAAGWSDTLFQSPLYYTPEELRWARGVVAYSGRWGAGWSLESQLGLGVASDTIRGNRRTLSATAKAGQVWGDRVRTLLEGRYGNSPGYSSWGATASLQIRVW